MDIPRRAADGRSTVELKLRVHPATKARVERYSARSGHTMSEYVTHLIEGATDDSVPAKPAAAATGTALLLNRVATRLATLRTTGRDEPGVALAIEQLDAVRREMLEAMQSLAKQYDESIDKMPSSRDFRNT